MTFDLPPIHHFKITAECPSHSRTNTAIRRHTVVVDEPEIRGGTDAGAAPLETMLAAFMSCHNVVSNLIAEEMGIELSDVTMALDATLDTNGLSTKVPTDLPFPEMKLTVNVTTSASDDEIARLRADIAKRCPVTVILSQAGTQIHSTWNVTRP
jgi:uncharacterized OsmC-like protein